MLKKIMAFSLLSLASVSTMAQNLRDADLVKAEEVVLRVAFESVPFSLHEYIYSPSALKRLTESSYVLMGVCAPQIESLRQISEKDIYRDEFVSMALTYSANSIRLMPLMNIYSKKISSGKYQLVTYRDKIGEPNHGDGLVHNYIVSGRDLRENLSIEVKRFIEIENNGDDSSVLYKNGFIEGDAVKKIRKFTKKQGNKLTYSCHMMTGAKEEFNKVFQVERK